ncbi:c-type cytochrome biogenesis protein CcmI [Shimia biformata]|uniref:c-type cytochrome biogenesis protein CcmI n=1 Tax=Shimia biformata TaxID=1294299 RepID=UPI00194DC9B5|nr:c-type cytochrome biogenesis protein CcmI [Shimia biformata]
MVFWIVAAGIVLTAIVLITLALVRGASLGENPAKYDLQVYKDQLKEVERDLARGVIGQEDATRVRTEISRRILAADAALKQGDDAGRARTPFAFLIAGLSAVVLVAGGFGLYMILGQPGYRDMPLEGRIADAKTKHATRADQATYVANLPADGGPDIEVSPEFEELMKQLRAKVEERPDDLQGHMLLARHEADLGNFSAAAHAQEQVIRINGDNATAEDYLLHANLLIAAAQGYVSPEAEEALRAALDRDHTLPLARYYMGLMLLQNDRPDLAFNIWSRLLAEGPADAPWIMPIRARIEDLAWIAGIDYTPPPMPGAPGPSAEDMQAAGEMSAEDREEMIRGMVAQLAERLAEEGGSPEEWARLISAYGVLGERDKATTVWEEAKTVFDGNASAIHTLREAARDAGVSP